MLMFCSEPSILWPMPPKRLISKVSTKGIALCLWLYRCIDHADFECAEISYHRESKLLCKKIVSFFGLLSKAQSADVRSGASPQVLKLVTALAHFLKLLIRIGLQGALRYEREVGTSDEIFSFLLTVRNVPRESDVDPQVIFSNIADPSHSWSDRCTFCRSSVEDECIVLRDGQRRWHSNPPHLICSVCNRVLTQDLPSARWSESNERLFCLDCAHSNVLLTAQGGFSYVTRLQQYVYLLYVSLARLAQVLRSQGSLRTSGKTTSFSLLCFHHP